MGSAAELLQHLITGLCVPAEVASQEIVRGDAVSEGEAPRLLVNIVEWVGVSVALPGGGTDNDQRRTLVDRHILP